MSDEREMLQIEKELLGITGTSHIYGDDQSLNKTQKGLAAAGMGATALQELFSGAQKLTADDKKPKPTAPAPGSTPDMPKDKGGSSFLSKKVIGPVPVWGVGLGLGLGSLALYFILKGRK